MIRIAVNSRIYNVPSSGISNYIKFLYDKLNERHDECSVFFLQTSHRHSLGRLRVFNLPKNSFFDVLFDLLVSGLLVGKSEIDIFHGPSHILPIIRKRGIRYVVTVHDLAFELFPDQYPWLFRVYYRVAARYSAKTADHVIAVSKQTKHDLVRLYNIPPKYISVVSEAVDPSFKAKPNLEEATKSKFFFSVSTHPKRKNILSVIDAFNASIKLKNHSFFLAGILSPRQKTTILEKVERLGLQDRVHILGYVSDNALKKLYNQADFFIYASFYEGFGLPVLEAMTSGCPVITSSTSSMVEFGIESRCLVDPNNVREITGAMDWLAELDGKQRQQLINTNQSLAGKYSWSISATETLSAFAATEAT